MFDSLVDQSIPVQILNAVLQKGRIPNCLLFSGMEGVGKKKAALFFAMAANCSTGNSPCGTCRSCKKILSENHPDILLVEPQGVLIKISQIRELIKKLNFRPFEANRRFVIIQDAHLMNIEAGNSLLKSLEEPAEKTHFILTTSQVELLLPTILSRSQQIRFNPISKKNIEHHLINHQGLDKEMAALISEMANGSISHAEKMAGSSGKMSDWMHMRNTIVDTVAQLSDKSAGALFSFASMLSKKKEDIPEHLEIIKTYLRDIIIYKYAPEKIIYKDLKERISDASAKNTIQSVLSRIDAIDEAKRRIQSNSNPRLTLEMLMIRISSV